MPIEGEKRNPSVESAKPSAEKGKFFSGISEKSKKLAQRMGKKLRGLTGKPKDKLERVASFDSLSSSSSEKTLVENPLKNKLRRAGERAGKFRENIKNKRGKLRENAKEYRKNFKEGWKEGRKQNRERAAEFRKNIREGYKQGQDRARDRAERRSKDKLIKEVNATDLEKGKYEGKDSWKNATKSSRRWLNRVKLTPEAKAFASSHPEEFQAKLDKLNSDNKDLSGKKLRKNQATAANELFREKNGESISGMIDNLKKNPEHDKELQKRITKAGIERGHKIRPGRRRRIERELLREEVNKQLESQHNKTNNQEGSEKNESPSDKYRQPSGIEKDSIKTKEKKTGEEREGKDKKDENEKGKETLEKKVEKLEKENEALKARIDALEKKFDNIENMKNNVEQQLKEAEESEDKGKASNLKLLRDILLAITLGTIQGTAGAAKETVTSDNK